MMDGEDEKNLYEQLDHLAELADTFSDGSGADQLAEVILTLTGMVYSRHRGEQLWALDPDKRDQADRVARRWLRDNGYMKIPASD